MKDDPRAMRTVLETFEACYRELERGGAVGIFPEGVTYNDALMRPMKSGTARMALELEQRHGGQLGLCVVPVGISYSGKQRYRSEVLLQFGEPIRVSEWLSDSPENRKAGHPTVQQNDRGTDSGADSASARTGGGAAGESGGGVVSGPSPERGATVLDPVGGVVAEPADRGVGETLPTDAAGACGGFYRAIGSISTAFETTATSGPGRAEAGRSRVTDSGWGF